MRQYNNEVDGLKKKFFKIQDNYNKKKQEDNLVLGTDPNQQNHRLVENEEQAWNQHSKLEHAKRSVIEMDSIGLEVVRDLKHQTDKMRDIQNKNDSLIHVIDDSNNVLTRMMKRENRNKLIIISASILLVAVFTIILFTKIV
jgi:hypothetical protein